MIHYYNHETLVVLVLFTVPFYHFSFSRYLELAERHFSSDILVPFPDSGVLYSSGSNSIKINNSDSRMISVTYSDFFLLKSYSYLPKKFFCFNDSPLKVMKYAFYFILKALFVLKIFKLLS